MLPSQTDQDHADYALGDLQWLQVQCRLRVALPRGAPRRMSLPEISPTCADEDQISLAARFGGSGLTTVITVAEKLRRVRVRRERYLEARNSQDLVDFLLRLRSTEAIFAQIRLGESKGRSYWVRKTENDYKHNWLLKYSTVRRYYEEVSDHNVYEPRVEDYGQRLIAMKGPADFARERSRKRRKAE